MNGSCIPATPDQENIPRVGKADYDNWGLQHLGISPCVTVVAGQNSDGSWAIGLAVGSLDLVTIRSALIQS
jgi:hypothetical protein